MATTEYWVQQGMLNQRERTVGYRQWSEHETKGEAVKMAKELKLARIIEVGKIIEYEDGKAKRAQ